MITAYVVFFHFVVQMYRFIVLKISDLINLNVSLII